MRSVPRIEVIDMNRVLKDSILLSQIRSLTLEPCDGLPSGMNVELTMFETIILTRLVKASAVIAYLGKEMIGWGLCSKEPSSFTFNTEFVFNGQGILFEIFVNPDYRQCGIASAIFKKAGEVFKNEKMFVCPWDKVSDRFYLKHRHIAHEII